MAMLLLYLALALTDPITPDGSVFFYFLGFVLVLISLLTIRVFVAETFPLKSAPVWLFFLFLIFHAAHSLSTHAFSDAFRSLVPLFCYFAVFFLVINMSWRALSKLVGGITILAVLAALQDFWMAVQLGYPASSADRLTYYAPASALPLSVLGVVIANSWATNRILRMSIITFLSFHILATQSKGLFICFILLVPMHAAVTGLRRSLTFRGCIIATVCFIALPVAVWILFTYGFLDRFLLVGTAQDVTTFGRLYEIEQATTAFLANPVFGTGSGYIFHHVHETLGFSERRYTHNSIFYFLAVSGVVGATLFFVSCVYPMVLGRAKVLQEPRSELGKGMAAAVCCLIVIFIYGLVSASFKLIHINILMALLQAFCYRGALVESKNGPIFAAKSAGFVKGSRLKFL